MMTGPRRIVLSALVGGLAALGVILALIAGRRPHKRLGAPVGDLRPVPAPVPASRQAGSGRGLAAGLLVLLLLAGLTGIVAGNRGAPLGPGPRATDGNGQPLAALPRPETDADAAPKVDTPARPGRTPGPGGAAGISPATPAGPTVPSFDIVRVEPNGDAVIAGQAAPNAAVELLVNGKPAARARAGADGRFTFMPPTLPPGNSEIGLRATAAQGEVRRSSTDVAVVIAPSRDARPLVALTAPDKPTVVLSQPDRPAATGSGRGVAPGAQALREAESAAAKPDRNPVDRRETDLGEGPHAATGGQPGASETGRAAANRAGTTASADPRSPADGSKPADRPEAGSATPVKIVSIDARDGGRLFVTARGPAGADVRLYLNDTLIAPATVGRDGSVTFTIGRGVRPGDYKVRLDRADPVTGTVGDRAEVAFSAPDLGRDEAVAPAAGPQDRTPTADGPDASRRRPAGEAQARREIPVDPADPSPARTGSPAASDPPGTGAGTSEVHVPAIETARIARGDSLWKISRRTYGEGERYTLIYDANQDQIRDPDLIYPGQVFVLPSQGVPGAVSGADRDPKRD